MYHEYMYCVYNVTIQKGTTACLIAAYAGHQDVVRLLLDKGAVVDQVDSVL